MKNTFSLLLLILIQVTAFAQYDKIDMSKYKLPDIKRHQLDFNLGLDNNYRKDHYESMDDRSNSSIVQNLSSDYNFYENSRELIRNYSVHFYNKLDSETRKGYNISDEKNTLTDLDFTMFFNNRFYMNGKNYFINVTPGLIFNYSNNTSKIIDFDATKYYSDGNNSNPLVGSVDVKTKDRSRYFIPSLDLGFGIGRVEPVGDVRHAIYIAEELGKANRLERDLTEDEIFLLAKRISELKNKRFFDSRLRKIYEIQSVDSLLNQMNVLNETDAVYFTRLTDMWDFGDQPRSAGTRLELCLMGQLSDVQYNDYTKEYNFYNQEYETTKEKQKKNVGLLGPSLRFSSYKPIGLKLQRLFQFSTTYHHFKHFDSPNYDYVLLAKNTFIGNSAYQLSWFLNTRTSIEGTVALTYVNRSFKEQESKEESLRAEIKGNLYYYFSPRLRVSYLVMMNRNWYTTNDNSNRLLGITNSLGIQYSLF